MVVAALAITNHATLNVRGMMASEDRAYQAEHVVELLQETHGPTSVIADQQAVATESHDDVRRGWYYLGVSTVGETLLFGSLAVSIVRSRRRDQN